MMSWLPITVFQGIKPLVLAVLVASFVGLQLPALGSPGTQIQAAPSEQVPPGQLTRKAFSGSVVAKSGSTITVGTKHGNIKVNVNSATVISAGPVKGLTLADILVGSKVAVKVDRSPVAPPVPAPDATSTDALPPATSTDAAPPATSSDSTPPSTSTDDTPTPEPTLVPTATPTSSAAVIESAGTTAHGLAQFAAQETTTPTSTPEPTATPSTSTDDSPTPTATPITAGVQSVAPSFRTVTARRIHLKQAAALIKHKRGVGKCKTKGKREIIDEDGEVVELDDETDNGTSSAALIPGTLGNWAPVAMLAGGGAAGNGRLLFRGIFTLQTSTNGTSTSSGSDGDGCGENLILLLRQKGRSTTTLAIRATLQADRIDARLARHIARLEAKGDTDAIERVTARAQQQKDRVEQRLTRTLARVDAKHTRDIQRALDKRKGRKASTSDGDGDGDGPTATPKPRGGGSSSSGGSGGSSGGSKKPAAKPTKKPKKN